MQFLIETLYRRHKPSVKYGDGTVSVGTKKFIEWGMTHSQVHENLKILSKSGLVRFDHQTNRLGRRGGFGTAYYDCSRLAKAIHPDLVIIPIEKEIEPPSYVKAIYADWWHVCPEYMGSVKQTALNMLEERKDLADDIRKAMEFKIKNLTPEIIDEATHGEYCGWEHWQFVRKGDIDPAGVKFGQARDNGQKVFGKLLMQTTVTKMVKGDLWT